MNDVGYRHALLVSSEGEVFPRIHARGTLYRNGFLHVADSRKGKAQVLTSDLCRIERKSKLGDRDILRGLTSCASPIKPSFLFWDWSCGEFLVGSFMMEKAHENESRYVDSQLSWFVDPEDAAAAPWTIRANRKSRWSEEATPRSSLFA
jgi:hypothetical protein